MSRIPKYAEDFIPTVEKRTTGSTILNVVAVLMCLIGVFATLRFFGVI